MAKRKTGGRGGATKRASSKGAKNTKGAKGAKGARGGAKRGSGKRSRLDTGTDVRYVRRRASGEFRESDDVGRSLRRDRVTEAQARVRSGYGDRGDRGARA